MPLFDNPEVTESTPFEGLENLEGQVQEEEGAELPEQQDEPQEEGQEEPEDSNPEEEAEEETEEEAGQLLLGKFKSPEDLANAYTNLQKKLGEMGNELAQLRRLAQQQQPQPQDQGRPQMTPEQIEQLNQRLLDDFQANPVGFLNNYKQIVAQEVLSQIQQQIQPLQTVAQKDYVEQNIERMAQYTDDDGVNVYPDVKELAPLMKQILLNDPVLLNHQHGFHYAYQMAKAQGASMAANQARQKGVEEGYKNAVAKKLGKMPGGKAKPKQPAKSPEELIIDEILSVRQGGLFS